MSKKEHEPPKGDDNAWMATFADLVTLLITFFVLLLSMSNLDAQSVEDSFGDAAENMEVVEVARGGAPELIESEVKERKRGMLEGGHRPSPMHDPEGSVQKGPSKASKANAEEVEDVLEDIISELRGKSARELVEGRVGDGLRNRFEALVALLNQPEFQGLFRLVLDRDRLRIHFAGDLLFHEGRVRIKPSSLLLLREMGRLLRGNGIKTRVIGVVQPDNAPAPLRRDLYPAQWDLAIARGCNVVRYLSESRSVPSSQMGCVAHLFDQKTHRPGDAVVFELRSGPTETVVSP